MSNRRFSAIIFIVDKARTRYFKNTITANITYSSFFIALGLLLPQVFHSVPGLAEVVSPMHIPVLVCAFFLDWPFALAVGVLTPALSSLFFSMPPFPAVFFVMVFELGVYAVTANLVYTKALKHFRIRHNIIRVYISLAAAMVTGRAIGACAAAASFAAFGFKGYTGFFAYLFQLFAGGIAAMAIQFLLIPPITEILKKKLIPAEHIEGACLSGVSKQAAGGEKGAGQKL